MLRNPVKQAPDATAATSRPAPDQAQASPDRQTLGRELLDELTAWPARDRGGVFKNWHHHSLSLVHLSVLSALEAEGPLPMRRLAEALDVSDASATGIVDRMERRGLVERHHGTGDRRQVLVHATAAGTRIFDDMAAHRRKRLIKVLAELSETEMSALLVGMRALRSARSKVVAADQACATATTGEPPPTG